MPGLLEMLLASHLQGRGSLPGLLSGQLPEQSMPGGPDEAAEAEAARQAAALRLAGGAMPPGGRMESGGFTMPGLPQPSAVAVEAQAARDAAAGRTRGAVVSDRATAFDAAVPDGGSPADAESARAAAAGRVRGATLASRGGVDPLPALPADSNVPNTARLSTAGAPAIDDTGGLGTSVPYDTSPFPTIWPVPRRQDEPMPAQPPIPGIGAVAGILNGQVGRGGASGWSDAASGAPVADLPPATNDPASGEPQMVKNGVPLPRPRPEGFGEQAGADASAQTRTPGAPLSISPPGTDAAPAPGVAQGGFDLGTTFGKVFNPRNAPLFLAIGSGLAGAPSIGTGIRRASAAAVGPAMMMEKLRQGELNQAQTYQALVARGVPPVEAVAAIRNPELLKAMVTKYFGEPKVHEVNGRLVEVKPGTEPRVIGNYPKDEMPSGFRRAADGVRLEYIPGGPADPAYKKEVGDRQNAPAGYRWENPNDPNSKLVPIEGGPATKVTPEVSARIGLARSFLDQLPSIRERVRKGDVTGPWDAALAKAGVGDPGEIRRQIDSGAEALLRNLTGAGMNMQEASEYVRRYRVSPVDTAAQLLSKMDQLERELGYVISEVERGRAPAKRKQPVGGKTSSGLTWSVEEVGAGQH